MNPCAFHRWTSFWLGLFVACFLAWAWRDSYRFKLATGIQGPDSSYGLLRIRAGTFLYYNPRRRLVMTSEWWWKSRAPVLAENWELRSDGTLFYKSYYPETRALRIPDAAVFFSFLGLWCGGMAWQSRRMKCLAARTIRAE